MSDPQPNPYAAGVVSQNDVDTEVEKIRSTHLGHEASVKSIWVVFLIGSALCGIMGAGFISVIASAGAMSIDELAIQIPFAILIFLLTVGYLVTGIGLARLSAWSRIPGCVLAGIGLLLFPIGTLINGYVLFLLLSPKGSTVFSEKYKEVIKQTPHMKYQTTPLAWGCLGLVLLALALGVVGAFFG